MKKFFISFFILCFTVIISPVYAVDVNIFNVPESVTNQPFEFNVSVNGAQSGTNYIKASFYKPETTSYFGYTFNNTDFYNGTEYSQYFPLIINSEGSGSATVKAKIDPDSSYFKGPGDYNFKVRRYTSQSYNTSSNEVTIAIDFANPTPTSTPEPTDEPTATPAPTATNTPSPIPTKIPSTLPSKIPTPTKKPSPTPSKEAEVSIPQSILGTASAEQTPEASPTPQETKVAGFSIGNLFAVAGGLIFILAGVLIFTFIVKKRAESI